MENLAGEGYVGKEIVWGTEREPWGIHWGTLGEPPTFLWEPTFGGVWRLGFLRNQGVEIPDRPFSFIKLKGGFYYDVRGRGPSRSPLLALEFYLCNFFLQEASGQVITRKYRASAATDRLCNRSGLASAEGGLGTSLLH